METQVFLSLLDKVRPSGRSWMACCPAHTDRSPSMRVSEKDGKILVYCLAGCTTHDVIGALGLDMKDLYIDSMDDTYKEQYRLRKQQEEREHYELVLKIARAQRKAGKIFSKEDLRTIRHAQEKLR